MKKIVIIPFLFLSIQVLAQNGMNFSISSPPQQLEVFAEGSVSTYMNERDFAISPDGTEIFFTVSTPKSSFQTIVFVRKIKEGEWTKPEIVSFAGSYSDLEPAFSADGKTLFFSSNRPIEGSAAKDFDIWKVTRTTQGWSSPINLGAPINTKEDEFYPSIARNGNLYFTAQYSKGIGKEDIYLSYLKDNTYQEPVALDSAVNSKLYEFNAYVSPDENYILFTSYGRKDDTGGGDLYISVKENGKWKPATNLKELNSAQLDYCPSVFPDGNILFITSERHSLPVSFSTNKATFDMVKSAYTKTLNSTGNIYWIDFRKFRENKVTKQ
jgi:Tol biopolymer transport system component